MQVEVCWGVVNEVLIVFWIVAAIECPLAFAEGAVYVAGLLQRFVLSHDEDIWFDELLAERGGLPHESFNELLVILAEHGWYGIPLGGEFEE